MKKLLALTLALALSMTLVLTGCGQPATPAEGDAAPAPADAPMKVALILSGPANDQGWNATAIAGLDAAKEQFGLETAYMENVAIADSEAAYRQYAAEGYNLIIGHGYQFGAPAAIVSAEYPDAYFMATESDSQSENMASFVMSCEQGAYLMGMLCGSMTKTNVIGVVGGFEQPSITKELEAFQLGAKEVNPQVSVLKAYVNSYTDSTLGKEAAMSMIGKDADVLYQVANQAGTGVIVAAQENGLYCCGNSYDQNSIAPDSVLCSTVYSMTNVILNAVSRVKDGTFEGGVYNLGMADDVVSISGYNGLEEKIPQEVRDLIAAKQAAIISGEFEVPLIVTATK
ncbi:MAG: BMP family protein [Oscillospiraceae bacterium]